VVGWFRRGDPDVGGVFSRHREAFPMSGVRGWDIGS
jgi:hypothetical protein